MQQWNNWNKIRLCGGFNISASMLPKPTPSLTHFSPHLPVSFFYHIYLIFFLDFSPPHTSSKSLTLPLIHFSLLNIFSSISFLSFNVLVFFMFIPNPGQYLYQAILVPHFSLSVSSLATCHALCDYGLIVSLFFVYRFV